MQDMEDIRMHMAILQYKLYAIAITELDYWSTSKVQYTYYKSTLELFVFSYS